MYNMPREVLLGLLLIDLPIDLDDKETPQIIPGRGSSWWFIVCDCDDAYPHIIREVLTLCTHQQIRELCFMTGGVSRKGGSIIRNATPKSKLELRKGLRFVGRYEFTASKTLYTDKRRGLKVFDALDFGEEEMGNNVYLHCFSKEKSYEQEIVLLEESNLSFDFIEDIHYFAAHELGGISATKLPTQYCVAVAKPDLTLARIVEGMPKDHEYRQNKEKFNLYLKKVSNVLRLTARAIKHMHEEGVVHGDIGPHTCGKFGDKWKLLNIPNSKCIGEELGVTRMGEYSPPETVEFVLGEKVARFKSSVIADESIDIWAYGKLCYEVFVGEVLIDFDPTIETSEDYIGLHDLGRWGERQLKGVYDSIIDCGVGPVGADLVSRCLNVDKRHRPTSMDEILKHPFWKANKKKKSSQIKSKKTTFDQESQFLDNEI